MPTHISDLQPLRGRPLRWSNPGHHALSQHHVRGTHRHRIQVYQPAVFLRRARWQLDLLQVWERPQLCGLVYIRQPKNRSQRHYAAG